MSTRVLAFIGAGILLLAGLCVAGYGLLAVISTTSPYGDSSQLPIGIGIACFGLLLLAGGGGLIFLGMRGQKTEVVQQVTMQVDLPGQTKIEQVKCQSCGGVLSAKDITLANGAPMVHCPYCNTVYQMTEEPKW
jgi:hypothetical protein